MLAHAPCGPELPPAIAAAVGILTFGSGGARHAVEQIAIHSRCSEAALPSIVRRLTFGDVPTSVWWTGDLSQSPPLTALVTMGRQLVYDSRQWVDVAAGVSRVTGLLEHPHAPDLANLGWRRLTPMRLALGHGLRGAGELLNAPTLRARVLHRPGEEALAWLLVGWLSSRLRRPSERELAVTVTEQAEGVEVMSISIDGGEATAVITATMNGLQVTVISTSDAPSFVVTVPQESDAGGVATELQTLRRDTGLIESIGAAHARLRAGGAGCYVRFRAGETGGPAWPAVPPDGLSSRSRRTTTVLVPFAVAGSGLVRVHAGRSTQHVAPRTGTEHQALKPREARGIGGKSATIGYAVSGDGASQRRQVGGASQGYRRRDARPGVGRR